LKSPWSIVPEITDLNILEIKEDLLSHLLLTDVTEPLCLPYIQILEEPQKVFSFYIIYFKKKINDEEKNKNIFKLL
jgi:hypothetical protein